MIAVTLGIIILGALTTFFVQTSANRQEMERNTRQIENGRYAIDTMRDDIALGGFYADTAPLVTPTWTTNDVCPANLAAYGFSIAPNYTAPLPVFGYANGVGAPLGCLQNLVLNNDIFAIRRFGSESQTTAQAAAAPTFWYLQNSQCVDDDPLVPLVVATGGGPFPLREVKCAGVARTWRLREQVYYLRTCSVCDPAPDDMPTLWRAELGPHADGSIMKHSALVEGIELMRADFGVDNTGDGLPDVWTRCDAASPCDAAAWANVTAVKVHVLSRNIEESPNYKDEKTYSMGLTGTVGPFNDKYKRHVYSAQIALPNRSGSREPQLAVAP
jgi:type IV pilus assembly protein PilW